MFATPETWIRSTPAASSRCAISTASSTSMPRSTFSIPSIRQPIGKAPSSSRMASTISTTSRALPAVEPPYTSSRRFVSEERKAPSR